MSAISDIDSAIDRSRHGLVLIFKHSITCGTSAQAYDELMTVLKDAPPLTAYIVCVQSDRSISLEIATRFGIRHESPQLFILEGGHVRWSGSHFHLNAATIRQVLTPPTKSAL
jgi:bacillithiol system protein YtxJ